MSTSKKIVFFGTDGFSAISLRRLLDAGFPIAAVVTKPDSQSGRGRTLTAPLVKTIALEHQLPVWQPVKLSEIAETIRSLNSPVGVLVSYGKIIPQTIIDLFNPGIVNVHPSLLPSYRGPSPIETAIRNGDTKTGVSIMQLTAAMDAGPVYSQVTHPLNGTETAPELEHTLGELGAEQLISILPDIIAGTCLPTPQDDAQATYCQLLDKSESILDPQTLTAAEAERRIRAYQVFPKTKLTVLGQHSVILEAHVVETQESPLDISCKNGTFLRIDKLITPNGRTMDAQSFLNGYRNK